MSTSHLDPNGQGEMIIKIHFSNENSGSDKLSDFARFIRRAKVRPNFAYEVADKPYDDAGVTDPGKLGRKS